MQWGVVGCSGVQCGVVGGVTNKWSLDSAPVAPGVAHGELAVVRQTEVRVGSLT